MSSDNAIIFDNVWKKYSKAQEFHNSLRAQIVETLFHRKPDKALQTQEFWALQGVSIVIQKGECIGLSGPNGSGKSTLLKLMANVTYPTLGSVTINSRIAPLIELGAGFHHDLTGRENILMNGTILGMTIKDLKLKQDEIIEFSGLQDFIDVPVKKYSSGMYLRLAFSVAIHSSAEIFLFDEVLSVGDSSFQKKCFDKITELNNAGKTIVIVSHDLESMKKITQRIVYLNKGVVVSECWPGE
jgi:ABC-type polysaccharide/polyol phosphate transport system ATPase subunit